MAVVQRLFFCWAIWRKDNKAEDENTNWFEKLDIDGQDSLGMLWKEINLKTVVTGNLMGKECEEDRNNYL